MENKKNYRWSDTFYSFSWGAVQGHWDLVVTFYVVVVAIGGGNCVKHVVGRSRRKQPGR